MECVALGVDVELFQGDDGLAVGGVGGLRAAAVAGASTGPVNGLGRGLLVGRCVRLYLLLLDGHPLAVLQVALQPGAHTKLRPANQSVIDCLQCSGTRAKVFLHDESIAIPHLLSKPHVQDLKAHIYRTAPCASCEILAARPSSKQSMQRMLI